MTNKPHYWQKSLIFLSKKDAVLAKLIIQFPNLSIHSRGDDFQTLARAVVGQQISTQVAKSIWDKLMINFKEFNYRKIANCNLDELKSCGLSSYKINYLKNLAHYFAENNINNNYWQEKTYTEIHNELIKIKGVGGWTIEMFAIFYLLESDIFPIKDLGLINAINKLYSKKKEKLKLDEIKKISDNWRPYRSVATWFLWRFIDAKATVY